MIYDPTASFAGWGDYQGFARTYDNQAFRERVLENIPKNFKYTVCKIFFEGAPTPQFDYAYYQPRLNMEMKTLLVERIK